MDTPTILGLDGGSLARRMIPDDDAPTVTMPAVGEDPSVLPWQHDYRVEVTLPGGQFAFASVMRVAAAGLAKPWSAYCAINAGESFKGWFVTAEAARAAVEEHIAAHVEAHLSEVSR